MALRLGTEQKKGEKGLSFTKVTQGSGEVLTDSQRLTSAEQKATPHSGVREALLEYANKECQKAVRPFN